MVKCLNQSVNMYVQGYFFVESHSVSCSSAGSDVDTWETSSPSKPTWFEMIVEEMLF